MCFGKHNHDEDEIHPPSRARSKENEQPAGFNSIVSSNASGLGFCRGCHEQIGWLLEDWKRRRIATDTSLTSTNSNLSSFEQQPRVFHDSFAQLVACADRCTSCRIIYQAFLLRQATEADQQNLFRDTGSLNARLMCTGNVSEGSLLPELVLRISVNQSDEYAQNAYIWCSRQQKYDFRQLSRGTKSSTPFIQQQLNNCRTNHLCSELDWSTSNPTRLIEIVDEHSIRLINGCDRNGRVPYMILSYCWGGVNTGITVDENLQRRLSAFDMVELPQTLQDAITIARQNDLRHVWIDQLCIRQDDTEDWKREAARMHEYYGNALFTLCAAANQKADERILKDRLAWKWNQPYCSLKGWNFAAFDTTLEQARRESPLSSRGWTLQEEYLSPRIVYWFNNALYWSCASSQFMENDQDDLNRPKQPEFLMAHRSRQPNNFLTACWKGNDKTLLHNEWLNIVESYTRRRLTVASDKFQALSGVAARYFTARQKQDHYLAGIWRETFAQELTFSVKQAGELFDENDSNHDQNIAPSWSWASLPADVHVDFRAEVAKEKVRAVLLPTGQLSVENDAAGDHVKDGSKIKQLTLHGLVGRAWSPTSKLVPWATIEQQSAISGKISFAQYRGEDAYSADPASGRLAIYRAHTQEIMAQIDYKEDARRIEKGELHLHYLAITDRSALLLHAVDDLRFRRVGVSYSDWSAAETTATEREIRLV